MRVYKRRTPEEEFAWYTQGNWTPLRVKVARLVQQHPLTKNHQRGPDLQGEEYDIDRIKQQTDASKDMVHFVSRALEYGAIPPTEEELSAAVIVAEDIPMWPPRPPKKVEPKATEIEPKKQLAAPEPDLSKIDMQKVANKIVEEAEAKGGKLETLDQKQKAEEPKPPLIPETHKLETRAEEHKPAEAKSESKLEDSKKILVGGELFGNVQKIKLTMGTIFWYFWCINVYGFEGSMDDFLNWAVTDAIRARGLSLDVHEVPIEGKG